MDVKSVARTHLINLKNSISGQKKDGQPKPTVNVRSYPVSSLRLRGCSLMRAITPSQTRLCSATIERNVLAMQSFWPFNMRCTVGCDVPISSAIWGSLQPVSARISRNNVQMSLSIAQLYVNG